MVPLSQNDCPPKTPSRIYRMSKKGPPLEGEESIRPLLALEEHNLPNPLNQKLAMSDQQVF